VSDARVGRGSRSSRPQIKTLDSSHALANDPDALSRERELSDAPMVSLPCARARGAMPVRGTALVRTALEHGFGVEIERERGEASVLATRGVSGGVAYFRRSSLDFVLAHAQTYDGVYV
jgi:hypothetical protein